MQDQSDPARLHDSHCECELTPTEVEIVRDALRGVFQRVIDTAFGDGPEQLAQKSREHSAKIGGRTQAEHARLALQSISHPVAQACGETERMIKDSREP